MTVTEHRAVVESPVGPLRLHADHDGNLTAVRFTLPDEPTPSTTPPGQIPPTLVEAVTQLDEYFTGRRRTFDLPLALHGTAFQRAAWRALTRIPYGATCSYTEQAALLGSPRATRAVGAANGRNPLPIVLPCHRVVSAGGGLGGFGGGLARKRWLLTHERDTLATDPRPGPPAAVLPPLQLPLIPLPR